MDRFKRKTTLRSLRKQDKAKLHKLDSLEVKILWADDYYDGFICGMAEVAGHRYRFDIIDYDALGSEDEHRDYWLISLEPEQLQDEEQWHELFCQKVGTHFDFTGRSPLKPDKMCLEAFYMPYQNRIPPDYTSNEVIGWFRL